MRAHSHADEPPVPMAFFLGSRYVSEEEAGRRLAKVVAEPAYAQSGQENWCFRLDLFFFWKKDSGRGVYFSWGGEPGPYGGNATCFCKIL